MLCQFCGAANPDSREACVRCGTKLMVVSGVVDETDEATEELFLEAQEELEEHLLERISGLEKSVRQLARAVASTGERLAQIEHNLTVTHAGVQALGGLLEGQGIVSRTEVIDGWERVVEEELLSRDLAQRFRDRARRILKQAEHVRAATPELRRTVRALELALVGGHMDQVNELLADLVAMAPDNDELWSFVGEASFTTGDLESARVAFRRVLELRGPHYETLIYLGTVASDLARWDEAEAVLHQALEMAPESFLPHFTIGALAVLRGRPAVAISYLEASLEREELAQTRYLLGLSYLHLELPGRAITELRRAVDLEPEFEDALYQLGLAYLRRGWNRRALSTFQQVLHLDPNRLQYQETVRLLRVRPTGDLPSDAARLVARAETALERGRTEAALGLFTSAVAAAPDQAGLRATAALLASSAGRARAAIGHAHRLLRVGNGAPYRAAAVVALLESLRQAGRPRAARRIARGLIASGDDPLARGMAAYELSLVEVELGEDLDAARDLAREALESSPRELRHYPLAALGAIALKRGRYREAVQYLEQAVDLAPQPALLRQLAVARLGAGDANGAEAALEAARGRRGGGLDEELLGHVRQLGSLLDDLRRRSSATRSRT